MLATFASRGIVQSAAISEEQTSSLTTLQRYHILYEAGIKTPSSDDLTADPWEAFEYNSPIGEKFSQNLRPGLFLLRLGGGLPTQLSLVKPDVPTSFFAQATLIDGHRAVVTSFDTIVGERRLGSVYCTNRPCQVWLVELPTDVVPTTKPLDVHNRGRSRANSAAIHNVTSSTSRQLSAPTRSARSPRFRTATPAVAIWLETPLAGPHNSTSAVVRAYIGKGLIPEDNHEIIGLDYSDASDRNSGLFVDHLPEQPFFEDEQGDVYFGLTTISGSKQVARTFSLDGQPHRTFGLGDTESDEDLTGGSRRPTQLQLGSLSWTFLAASGQEFLLQRSDLSFPPQVLHFDGSKLHVVWQSPLPSTERGGSLVQTSVQVLRIPSEHQALETVEEIEAVLLTPADRDLRERRCILLPHGGPHGTTLTSWSPTLVAWCLAGYSVIAPNYHGSLGRSRAFVDSLIGKAGVLDVEDCLATVRFAISEGIAESGQLYLSGGSHGGFLAAHLAGRYPNMWQAVVMRNPVTHVAEQFATTDIRDWCLSEFGYKFDFSCPPAYLEPSVYAQLHDASPFRHYEAVQAPILLCIGSADQRVPPSQGISFYHALKAAGKTVKICWFDKADHALDTVESARGSWLASWKWFEQK